MVGVAVARDMHTQPLHLSDETRYAPPSLLFQWHITERCNLRCAHCYQDNYARDELSFENLLTILVQYKTLLATLSERRGKRLSAHITVTGGEPFARRDFLDLLEIFAAHRKLFSFAILTNGTFIDAQMALRLRQLAPRFVQVSIEGTETTHDRIRGKGNFAQTVAAIKQLRRERIRTLISFTAHRQNFREFPAVAQLGQQLNVNRVWADRLIPWGSGAQLREQVMTPAETQTFFELMKTARDKRVWFNGTDIAMHRALQFMVGDGQPYHCTAGDTLLTVQPNGDLYPCRRMPIRVGNLLETPLLELYDNSTLLRQLRHPAQISEGCQDCFYAKLCRGGLKCLSYAVTGEPFKADPGCWLQNSPP
ncbi:heme d1 biosynthesis protein [Beggiatoa sp. SS]|nr:heme d1 biosynthesis protein [Beggiatoa sp. SS]